jgi:SAM-dependent methyltransferase
VEPLRALDDGVLAALRERLSAASYDDGLLSEAERVAPRQLDAVRLPLVHAWLARRGGPGSTAAALFGYAATLSEGQVRSALGDELCRALLAAQVLGRTGEGISSRYRLVPLSGLLLLSDPPEAGPEAAVGPGPTTLTLARLLPESPGSVLDLGCGAGTLALLAAARGAPRVLGVDLSPRAVALARENARLNRLTAEFREGDLLAPVAGERFDLLVGQPPYVVLPDGVEPVTWLHGGPLGEELALRFAGAALEALGPGGLALLHFDSPVLPGRPLLDRVRRALSGADADLALLTTPGPSPDLQAAAYGALDDPGLGERYRATVRRYRAHLAEAGIESFSRVLALLRRAAVPGGGFAGILPVPSLDRLGPEDIKGYLAGLALAGAPEAALLAARVEVAHGARLVEETVLGGARTASQASLHFDRGVAADQAVSEATLALLEALQGAPDVAGALSRYAEALGAAPAEVRGAALAALRDGLARGVFAVAGLTPRL